tara:strand:+ start:207 stop:680 length:474 start_codon:yes stop_codon:yes gene_type:complete
MGVLDNLFGSANKEDDKYLIYTAMAMQLANADGETSQSEADFVVKYLREAIPAISENRLRKIIDRAMKEGPALIDKVNSLNQNEKEELIGLLIGVAASDGKFHGNEAVNIFTWTIFFGLDFEKVKSFILDNYDIDNDELTKAMANVKKNMEKHQQDD